MFGSKAVVERREECALCGKNKAQVSKLIVGLKGAVCSDCTELCNDILHSDDQARHAPAIQKGEGGWDGAVRLEPWLRMVFGSEDETLVLLRAIAPLIQGYQAQSATEASEPEGEQRS